MKRIFIATALLLISATSLAVTTLDLKVKTISKQHRQLRKPLVKMALQAFYNAQKLGVRTKKPIMTIIDYSLPSTEKRLWVVDLERDKIIYNSLVAHGRNSGENHTTVVSNKIGSLQTSVGLFLTENTYFGRDGYSLRMIGLEKGFNHNAMKRTIVMHGAPYVSKQFIAAAGRIGRSWGCPAVEKPLAEPIIDTIKHGSLIFSYYPDQNWLTDSKFVGQQVLS
jgi:hypothetical protein